MAACAAGPRWGKMLVPFVEGAMRSLWPKPGDEEFNLQRLQHAAEVLRHLGRPDLACKMMGGVA